jgi:hypothetical protein
MARKYGYAQDRIGWAMDPHEERWLIGRYFQIEPNILSDQRWKFEFENYFFHSGTGVGEIYLQHMNSHCSRLSLPPISFPETNVEDYARSPDHPNKAHSRSLWREDWCDLSAPERATMMREWEMQMAEAEPAHRTYEEVKGDREQDTDYISRQERQRRETAVITAARRADEEAQEARTRAATERATRLARQLRMAATLPDAEALLASLMQRIEPVQALDLADEMDDLMLKTTLLKCCMD